MRIILLFAILSVSTSCSHYKWIQKHRSEVQGIVCAGDSIRTIKIEKIDTFTVIQPKEVLKIKEVSIPCPDGVAELNPMTVTNNGYTASLSVKNGYLTAEIERLRDTLELYGVAKIDTIYSDVVREVVKKEPIPRIYRTAVWVSLLLIVLLGVLVYAKIKKMF